MSYESFSPPGNGKTSGLIMDGYVLETYTTKSPYYYYYTRNSHKFTFYNINAPYQLQQYTAEQKATFAKSGVIIADDGSITVKHGANVSILKDESAKWATDSSNMLKYPLSTPGAKKDWTFAGWYQDAMGTIPVTDELWNEEIIENITIYAKWEPPKYSLTYIIPDGYVRSEIIDKFSAVYNCTVINEEDRQIVRIDGIPEGTATKEFADLANDGQDVAINDFGYAFEHWIHSAGSGKEVEFIFSESHKIYNDLTLTAEWKREPIGKYTVHYLTKDDIAGAGYGDIILDGTTYHQLLPEKFVQGLYYGQTVSENSEEMPGYLAQEYKKTFELTEDADIYFIYDKITADITYYVHYILDTGVDYGTTVPVENVVELIPSKKVVIDGASVKTSITETAEVIGGYTPREQWTGKLSLSVNENNNHLYFYYNYNNPLQEYRIEYIFMNSEGNYDDGAFRYVCNGSGGIGQVLYGKSYAEDYTALLNNEEAGKILDEHMKGHVFDEDISDEYVFIDGETVPVLYVYMKNGTYTLTVDLNDSDSDNKAIWEAPVEFTKSGDGRYSRSIVYPDYISEPINKPVRKAYVFSGWSYYKEATEPDESIDIFKEGGLHQDTVIYAVWKQASLIYIDSLLGTENNEYAVVDAVPILSASELLRSMPHDGYLFRGWYLDAECTIPYNPDNPPEDFLIYEKNYLYAGWRTIGTVATDDTDEVLEMCDGSSYTEINNMLPEFEMVGARIRTYEAAGITQGEWFISRISEQLVNDVESLNPMNIPLQPKTANNKSKGYGTVVTLAQRIEQSSEFLKDEKAVSVSSGNFVSPATLTLLKCNGYKYYSCAVQGMPESYYDKPLLCRPYITYYDCNGNLYTYYYTETGEAYTTERMSGSYAGGYAISYWYTAKYMIDEGFYAEDTEDYKFLQYVYGAVTK